MWRPLPRTRPGRVRARGVFAVMERAPQHVFHVLDQARRPQCARLAPSLRWPANVWMGVTVEHEDYVWRADALRQVPTAPSPHLRRAAARATRRTGPERHRPRDRRRRVRRGAPSAAAGVGAPPARRVPSPPASPSASRGGAAVASGRRPPARRPELGPVPAGRACAGRRIHWSQPPGPRGGCTCAGAPLPLNRRPRPLRHRRAGGKTASASSRSGLFAGRGAVETTSSAPPNVTNTPTTSCGVGCRPVRTTEKTMAHAA